MNLLAALPEWFTTWGWIVLVVAVVALIGAIVGLCVHKRKSKTSKEENAETADEADNEAEQNAAEQEIEKVQAEQPEEDSEEEKEEQDKAEEQETAPDKATQIEEQQAKKPLNKTYHIGKRKSDGKWQVKMAGGAKAIKLFSTQLEAINYAKKLAENQEAKIVIHKEDGTFRRLTYHNKKQ